MSAPTPMRVPSTWSSSPSWARPSPRTCSGFRGRGWRCWPTAASAGAVDVAVCDGFTGNVALKVAEGVADRLMGALRDAALSSARGRLGGALLRPQLLALRSELDAEAQGGAYLLGLRAPIVIAHGRFSQVGLAAAVA